MTFPYRIVWHSLDPTALFAPLGPGDTSDFITIQRLLPPRSSSQTRRMTHVIYFHYNSWDAEFYCHYDEAMDWIEDVSIKRMNRSLRAWVADPEEFESALLDSLPPSEAGDPSIMNEYLRRGPLDVRMRPEKDDEGNRIIQVCMMCRSVGHGAFIIRFAGKLWDPDLEEVEDELLTNSERRRLGVTDSHWTVWGGQDPDAD